MSLICMTSEKEKNLDNVKIIKENDLILYMKTEYVNCVIKEWERNGYNDSDFFALVWDFKTMSSKTIEYATTRFWTYPNKCNIDASKEVLKYYQCEQRLIDLYHDHKNKIEDHNNPTVSKNIIVIGGRKHKNKTGKIFWRGANKYKTYYSNGYNHPNDFCNQVLGVKTNENETIWIPASYAKVTDKFK